MGAGNWFPSTEYDHDTVYVSDVNYHQLCAQIHRLLPPSFDEADRWRDGRHEGKVIAESCTVELAVIEWNTYIAVSFIAKDHLGERHLTLASRVFDALHRAGYYLAVRSCAWTSSPYSPRLAA